MVAHQLAVVLVGGSHIDLVARFLAQHGERTDDVIRLETGHLQHRYIHCLQELLDDGHGFAYVLRRLGTLRLVLLVRLVAEGTALGVKRHAQMRGVDFSDEVL